LDIAVEIPGSSPVLVSGHPAFPLPRLAGVGPAMPPAGAGTGSENAETPHVH